MEIEYWTFGSTNFSPGKVSVLSRLFLKRFVDKNFDDDGNLRNDNCGPILIYRNEKGVQRIPIIRIIGSYVQAVDGKIYKLKGLEHITKFKSFNDNSTINIKSEYAKERIQYFSATGKNHQVNEDYYLGVNHPNSTDIKLLVVADGMGGYTLGDEASHTLVKQLLTWFNNQSPDTLENTEWLSKTILDIIKEISFDMFFEFALKRKIKCGSTLALAIINSTHTIMVNVGDSRIGLVQNGVLNIVSIDDSPLTGDKPPTPLEQDLTRILPGNNYITQYVGKKDIEPHIHIVKNTDYTDLFLFSDGITDCINYSTLNRIACNIDKETLFKFITEASFGEETEGAKGKATDDETVVHYSRR